MLKQLASWLDSDTGSGHAVFALLADSTLGDILILLSFVWSIKGTVEFKHTWIFGVQVIASEKHVELKFSC